MQQPQLAKPGAGLPWFEALLAKYWVMPRMSRKMSWDDSVDWYRKETEKIYSSIRGVSQEKWGTRVLVPRLRGLEDSSRYWSILETLEHLMRVGEGMAGAVHELGHGRVPQLLIQVAAFKPKGALSLQSGESQFRACCDGIVDKLTDSTLDRKSKARLYHPWFGELCAYQWNWLCASHQWIHRNQIQKIAASL
jgi:hypothetical protein